MSEDLQSVLLVVAVLFPVLVGAFVLASTRLPRRDRAEVHRQLVDVFLIGIACQCGHSIEEFSTGLHLRYPPLFGFAPLSAEFFVGFNLSWIGIWVLSVFGVRRGLRVAYFPVWFFGLAMCLNGVIHPLLAVWAGGYFPGLMTSPVVATLGVLVTKRLFEATQPRDSSMTWRSLHGTADG